ncbi:hypothetical protein ACHAWC_002773, partial [Mediolabrus comicus]
MSSTRWSQRSKSLKRFVILKQS